MKHIEKIFNAETGEETIVERDFTKEELAEIKAAEERSKLAKKEAETRAAARQAILDRLGLTEEEARLLLG